MVTETQAVDALIGACMECGLDPDKLKDAMRASVLPADAPPGLLMSMAMRFDHGLGVPGYYDSEMFQRPGQPSHAQRLEATLATMRQLYEEVSGRGFYRAALEAEYVARSKTPNAKLNGPQGPRER